MSTTGSLADRSGSLVESHKGYDPRVVFFYFIIGLLLLVIVGGLAYQQLVRSDTHERREKFQNHRRVVVPGPRGNIYARDGLTILVGNRPRFSVVLYLDELKTELRREHIRIHDNFLRSTPKEIPNYTQLEQIARVSVVQRYLDQVNHILGRESQVDVKALREHFNRQLLLPYTLLDDLAPEDYAKLLEGLPVRSPVQVYSSSRRFYPYGSAAAHTLGYVRADENPDAEEPPDEKLKTFKMKGTIGRDGLEKAFDSLLQGEAGGTVFRVDPAGFRVDPPLAKRLPVQGKNLITSLDIDLQLTAEQAIGDQTGAAVALDIATGEVLLMASKPDYNLNDFSPRASKAVVDDMNARGSWNNLALDGVYPPGSTFKILTSIAALRSGNVTPDEVISDCQGTMRIGNAPKTCDNGHARHGEVKLSEAIAVSCDIYYYTLGLKTTPEVIAAEARRFHFGQRTGIELPGETRGMTIPDPDWKRRTRNEAWYPGDTANMSIGQGDVLVTPLEMACFAASVGRGETYTVPTLVHDANRPRQHTEPIGLTLAQRAALIEGMVGCTTTAYSHSTASNLTTVAAYRIPGVRIAGKTGTAQKMVTKDGKRGNINFAWFMCFAPADNPEVAVAVILEGDTVGESYGGGANAGPVAATILKKYFEKKNRPALSIKAPANSAP
jgi:penicillin-binding protein 2